MTKLKNTLGWGILLWLVGYILGFVFFFLVPPQLIGWFISPIGIAMTIWVIIKKTPRASLSSYFSLGLIWTILAIMLDYIFIVKLLNPQNNYYKPDVYLYYIFTLLLPLLVGWYQLHQQSKTTSPSHN